MRLSMLLCARLLSFRLPMRVFSTQSMTEEACDASNFRFIHEKEVTSTQDAIRQHLNASSRVVALLADIQTQSRGTKGRKWESATGNLHLTVALPQPTNALSTLSLRVGLWMAQAVKEQISDAPVVIKWPNDVLVDGKKIAGCLIESYTLDETPFPTWMLIGIGINVHHHPTENMIRPATSLKEFTPVSDSTALAIGKEIAARISRWDPNKQDDLIVQVLDWMKFEVDYKLRDSGENVTTVGLEVDGQLRVRDAAGQERLLMADYLE